MAKEKTYKDMLGNVVQEGNKVLHLWTDRDPQGYARGGKGAVKSKVATVVKINPKTIRIRWKNSHEGFNESNITNTRNRIIILSEERKILLDSDKCELERLKDNHKKHVDKLRNKVDKLKERLIEEGEIRVKLSKTIKKIQKDKEILRKREKELEDNVEKLEEEK